MLPGAERTGHLHRPLDLDGVPLSVTDGQRVALEAPLDGQRQRRCGIETSGQQHDGPANGEPRRRSHHTPRVADGHSTLCS